MFSILKSKKQELLSSKLISPYVLGLALLTGFAYPKQVQADSVIESIEKVATVDEPAESLATNLSESMVTESLVDTSIHQDSTVSESVEESTGDQNIISSGPVELTNTILVSELLPPANLSVDIRVSDLGPEKVVEPVLKREILDAKMTISLVPDSNQSSEIYLDKTVWKGKESFYRFDETTGAITFDSAVLIYQGLSFTLSSELLKESIAVTFNATGEQLKPQEEGEQVNPEKSEETKEHNKLDSVKEEIITEVPKDFPTVELGEIVIEFKIPNNAPTYDLPEIPIEFSVPNNFPTVELLEAPIPEIVVLPTDFPVYELPELELPRSSILLEMQILSESAEMIEDSLVVVPVLDIPSLVVTPELPVIIDLDDVILTPLLSATLMSVLSQVDNPTELSLTVRTRSGKVTKITPVLNASGQLVFSFPDEVIHVLMAYKTSSGKVNSIAVTKNDEGNWESDAPMISSTEEGDVILDTTKLPKDIVMTVSAFDGSDDNKSGQGQMELAIFETPKAPSVILSDDNILIEPDATAVKMLISYVTKDKEVREIVLDRRSDGTWISRNAGLFVSKNTGMTFFYPNLLSQVESFTAYTVAANDVKSFETNVKWSRQGIVIEKQSDKPDFPKNQLVTKSLK